MLTRRTDLAVEARALLPEGEELPPGVSSEESESHGFSLTRIVITQKQGADALGKPEGTYLTLELTGLLRREADAFSRAAAALSDALRPLLPDTGDVLVVGLGNRDITPDAVGPLAVAHTLVTRHLVEGASEQFSAFRPVAALAAGVLAGTGVESSVLVEALCRRIRPACVIAVDALAARSVHRLCRTVQLCDTGITPGSGVGNQRKALNRDTLGVPVIAVGVPTVVDAATLALDLLEEAGCADLAPESLGDAAESLMVTPREIDVQVRQLAKVIGYGVNLAVQEGLCIEDVDLLLE